MVETSALLGVVAKLIGLGVEAWKAGAGDGLHSGEIEALEEALATLSEFDEAFGKDVAERTLVRQHCELLTVAFGEAWRRHWHCDALLAPGRMQGVWTDVFRPRALRQRVGQLEEALRDAKLDRPTAREAPSQPRAAMMRRRGFQTLQQIDDEAPLHSGFPFSGYAWVPPLDQWQSQHKCSPVRTLAA